MSTYFDSINPNDLTINDLVEIQGKPNADKVLYHYKGELMNPDTHYCSLCNRRQKLKEFFQDFEKAWLSETGDGEMHELQYREHLLAISQDEWNQHGQEMDRAEMERYGRHPF